MDCNTTTATHAVKPTTRPFLVRSTLPIGPDSARVILLAVQADDEVHAHEVAIGIEPSFANERVSVCRLTPMAIAAYGMPAAMAYVVSSIEEARGAEAGSLRLGTHIDPAVAGLLAEALIAAVAP